MTSEEDVESEMVGYDDKTLKKMQEENKKKAEEQHNGDDKKKPCCDKDGVHHDENQSDGAEANNEVYTVIESITDAATGENIEFKVDEPTHSGDKSMEAAQMNFNLETIVALKKISTNLHNHISEGSEISVLVHQQQNAIVNETDMLMDKISNTIEKLANKDASQG